MDKTVSISLGGFPFIIDENAYTKLKVYLNDVKTSLRGTEGIEDIIEDVEIRIAELFRDNLKFREVVGQEDVEKVISIMGSPEQYKVDEDETSSNNHSQQNHSYTHHSTGDQSEKKRLFRDPDDHIITGLSAGLAHYMGLDPWAVRTVWLVLAILGIFTAGVSLFLVGFCYFVLLLFVPKAQTTTEKLQMYGKPANIETLKKNVQEASDTVLTKGQEVSKSLGGVFGWFGKLLLWFFGFTLISTGVSLIIGGFAIMFTMWTQMPTQLFGYLVEDEWMSLTVKVAAGILCVVPGILITLLGLKCFSSIKVSKALIFGSIIAWFIALLVGFGITISTASKFKDSVEFVEDKTFDIPSDTLQISFNSHDQGNYKYRVFNNNIDQLIDADGNLIIPINDSFDVKESLDDQFHLQVKYEASGGSSLEAKRNLEMITYNYQLKGNTLALDEFIKVPKKGKFRNQTVDITLFVPKNKLFVVQKADRIGIAIINNERENFYDVDRNLFQHNGKRFVCLNCESTDNDYETDYSSEDDSAVFKANTPDTQVLIDENGIRVTNQSAKGKKEKAEIKINNNQIQIKDDTDSINIHYRNHQGNR